MGDLRTESVLVDASPVAPSSTTSSDGITEPEVGFKRSLMHWLGVRVSREG